MDEPQPSQTPSREPPWLTSPDELEPNDDRGRRKTRPKIEKAAKYFRKYFEHEPWFVTLMGEPISKRFLVLVADARYYSKHTKQGTWMGWPIAVARLQGFHADATRRDIEKEYGKGTMDTTGKQALLQEAGGELVARYGGQAWYVDVDGGVRPDGTMWLNLHVNSKYTGPLKLPQYKYKGEVIDLFLIVAPDSVLGGGDDPLGVK